MNQSASPGCTVYSMNDRGDPGATVHDDPEGGRAATTEVAATLDATATPGVPRPTACTRTTATKAPSTNRRTIGSVSRSDSPRSARVQAAPRVTTSATTMTSRSASET